MNSHSHLEEVTTEMKLYCSGSRFYHTTYFRAYRYDTCIKGNAYHVFEFWPEFAVGIKHFTKKEVLISRRHWQSSRLMSFPVFQLPLCLKKFPQKII